MLERITGWLVGSHHRPIQIIMGALFASICPTDILADEAPLAFRAMVIRHRNPAPWTQPAGEDPWAMDSTIDDRDYWEPTLLNWHREGINAVIIFGRSEVATGDHVFLEMIDYPEAREQPADQIKRNIYDLRWLIDRAKELGMETYLYTGAVHYTAAFAKAHDLDKPLPISPTVSISQNQPDGGWAPAGVRNQLTREYTASIYLEMLETYPDLAGFFGPMGEALPGRRSTWFQEAIVPALLKSGRNPRYIVHQWQIPVEEYVEDIVGVYDNTWLGVHGHNSEQITDPQPYPFVRMFAEKTGLPTVDILYPANVSNFPMNSPRFAYEIVREIRNLPNIVGFAYWEWSGRNLSPLFRMSLARYAKTDEPYSDEPWIDILEEKYGDRKAAEHFLKAFDISARIIPEADALIWCGHDNYRRELRIPYSFLTGDGDVYSRTTSRVRGRPLVTVWDYAKWVSRNPAMFEGEDGTDTGDKPGQHTAFRQIAIWRTEGGSVYDVIPPDHMAMIRQMGEKCYSEASKGIETVTRNHEDAQLMLDFMAAYRLLARYYEVKVAAATAAIIAHETGDPNRRSNAELLADQAVLAFEEMATFMHQTIDPEMVKMDGRPIEQLVSKATLLELMEEERQERAAFGKIFNWP